MQSRWRKREREREQLIGATEISRSCPPPRPDSLISVPKLQKMGCCDAKAAAENEVELKDMKHFQKHPVGGVQPKRKCRDVLCGVFFVIFWVGMFIIAGFALSQGHPERYDHPFSAKAETLEQGPAADHQAGCRRASQREKDS